MDVAAVSMFEIVERIREQLAGGGSSFECLVLDPSLGEGRHAGAPVLLDGAVYMHRPWSTWVDLASRLHLRLGMPVRVSETHVRLRFERLVERVDAPVDRQEKYGTESEFAAVHKLEDPSFVVDMCDVLSRASLPERPRVLFLGVNRGDEVRLVGEGLGRPIDAVGVDHSRSAILEARRRFPSQTFVEADLNELFALELGRFDLVVAIDVLHSPRVDDSSVLQDIVKRLLDERGTVCIGVPNCRYLDGERLAGARTRNFTQPELSLLFKRVAFYRRYLGRQGFQVFVTGQYEVLVTGVRRPTESSEGG